MKKILYIIAILITIACTSSPKLTPLPPDAVILAFGDSITHGTGAEPDQSYPAVLSGLIFRKVIEAGIPGEVTSEGLVRLPHVIDNYRPALLILCHGGNDLLKRMGHAQISQNIVAMIRLAKQKGIQVVLIGVPKPGLNITPPKFYEQIAAESGIPYDGVTLKNVLKDNSLKSDIIHPNAKGYRIFAEAVAKLLKKSGAI